MESNKITNFPTIGDCVASAQTIFNRSYFIWWRGQPVDKPLIPAVFRIEKVGMNLENNLRSLFTASTGSRYPNCPDEDDSAGWLFLMQHHGLNTRLLDWTLSILIGIYFAVNKDFDQTGVLYALDPFKLNKYFYSMDVIFNAKDKEIIELYNRPFSMISPYIDKVAAINPIQNNIRMLLQQSMFTIHGSNEPLEHYLGLDKWLVKFIIPPENKVGLLKILDQLGINESTIFPELEHLANYINKKIDPKA